MPTPLLRHSAATIQLLRNFNVIKYNYVFSYEIVCDQVSITCIDLCHLIC